MVWAGATKCPVPAWSKPRSGCLMTDGCFYRAEPPPSRMSGKPRLLRWEGLGIPMCFFSQAHPTIGAAQDYPADVTIWMGYLECPEATPRSVLMPCLILLLREYSEMFRHCLNLPGSIWRHFLLLETAVLANASLKCHDLSIMSCYKKHSEREVTIDNTTTALIFPVGLAHEQKSHCQRLLGRRRTLGRRYT